jgi:hypothetical protein
MQKSSLLNVGPPPYLYYFATTVPKKKKKGTHQKYSRSIELSTKIVFSKIGRKHYN